MSVPDVPNPDRLRLGSTDLGVIQNVRSPTEANRTLLDVVLEHRNGILTA